MFIELEEGNNRIVAGDGANISAGADVGSACPVCAEFVAAEHDYCPYCGAKLHGCLYCGD